MSYVPPNYNQSPPPASGGSQFFDSLRASAWSRPSDRWIGGVCGAISQRSGWDISLVRGLAVLAAFLTSGLVLIAYALAWALLPEQVDGRVHLEQLIHGRMDVAYLGQAVLLLMGMSSSGPSVSTILNWGYPNPSLSVVWSIFSLTVLGCLIAAVIFVMSRPSKNSGSVPPSPGPLGAHLPPYGQFFTPTEPGEVDRDLPSQVPWGAQSQPPQPASAFTTFPGEEPNAQTWPQPAPQFQSVLPSDSVASSFPREAANPTPSPTQFYSGTHPSYLASTPAVPASSSLAVKSNGPGIAAFLLIVGSMLVVGSFAFFFTSNYPYGVLSFYGLGSRLNEYYTTNDMALYFAMLGSVACAYLVTGVILAIRALKGKPGTWLTLVSGIAGFLWIWGMLMFSSFQF